MDLDKNMRSVDSNLKLDLEEERDKRVRVIYRIDFNLPHVTTLSSESPPVYQGLVTKKTRPQHTPDCASMAFQGFSFFQTHLLSFILFAFILS